MARTPKSDMIDFVNWLVSIQFVKRTTAQNYASHVRHVLSDVEDFSIVGVNAYFTKLGKKGDYRFSTYKTAWSRYALWASTIKGITLPTPTVSQRAEELPPLPEKVREAVSGLAEFFGRDLPLYGFPDVYWFHVTMNMGKYRVTTPEGNLQFVIDQPHWIEALREYAQPPEDGSIPLVPLEPGHPDPYPGKGLRREVRIYRSQ